MVSHYVKDLQHFPCMWCMSIGLVTACVTNTWASSRPARLKVMDHVVHILGATSNHNYVVGSGKIMYEHPNLLWVLMHISTLDPVNSSDDAPFLRLWRLASASSILPEYDPDLEGNSRRCYKGDYLCGDT